MTHSNLIQYLSDEALKEAYDRWWIESCHYYILQMDIIEYVTDPANSGMSIGVLQQLQDKENFFIQQEQYHRAMAQPYLDELRRRNIIQEHLI